MYIYIHIHVLNKFIFKIQYTLKSFVVVNYQEKIIQFYSNQLHNSIISKIISNTFIQVVIIATYVYYIINIIDSINYATIKYNLLIKLKYI